jgi:hypothetical protein
MLRSVSSSAQQFGVIAVFCQPRLSSSISSPPGPVLDAIAVLRYIISSGPAAIVLGIIVQKALRLVLKEAKLTTISPRIKLLGLMYLITKSLIIIQFIVN